MSQELLWTPVICANGVKLRPKTVTGWHQWYTDVKQPQRPWRASSLTAKPHSRRVEWCVSVGAILTVLSKILSLLAGREAGSRLAPDYGRLGAAGLQTAARGGYLVPSQMCICICRCQLASSKNPPIGVASECPSCVVAAHAQGRRQPAELRAAAREQNASQRSKRAQGGNRRRGYALSDPELPSAEAIGKALDVRQGPSHRQSVRVCNMGRGRR